MKKRDEEPVTVAGFKGFDRDFKCREFAYTIGETYTIEGEPVRCTSSGFHAVEMPLDAWSYYAPGVSRFGAVVAGGTIDRGRDDTKFAAASITVTAELKLPDFIKSAVAWIVARAGDKTATGYRGHAAATGDSGHAAATGDSGHAAATGYSGHAAATGPHGIAASLGPSATATAGADGWIVLAAWKWNGDRYVLITVRSAKVGGPEGVKAGIRYALTETGEFSEATP